MQPDILVARAMSGRDACWKGSKTCLHAAGRRAAVHDLLKGREYNRNKAMEGFDEARIACKMHQGGYADVLRLTMVGILRCGKMLPPQLNLVIEIEFADATTALWSENAGAHPSGATLSTDFEIQNVRVLPGRPGLCAGRVLQPRALSQEGRSCSATPRCTRSSPASRTEWRNSTSPWRAPSRNSWDGQGPPSITDRLRSTADGAQAAADLIGAGAAGLAAAQAFRSQLPQDAAEYVRLNVLPRPGQAQPPPQIIGRPSDVERLLGWSVAQRRPLRRRG